MSPWLWAFTLCVLFFLALRLLLVLVSAISLGLFKNPSHSKVLILGSEAIAGFAFAQFASLMRSAVVSLALGAVLFLGSKLRQHLKRRTTAAYSTSDLYHQRLFNLTILFQMFGLSLGVLIDIVGVSIPRLLHIPFFMVPSTALMVMLTMAALVEAIRDGLALAVNGRTLAYLVRNYFDGWRGDKLKRIF